MKMIGCLLLIAGLLSACEKAESVSENLEGKYVGLFSRTGMDTSQVILNFHVDQFEGQTNMARYPAICKGEFELDEETITFNDSCAWTADFDWSLILSGTYNISFTQGIVRIWKSNGAVTDEYILRQPAR